MLAPPVIVCAHPPAHPPPFSISYPQQQLPSDKHSKEQWWYPFAKIGCGAAAGIAAQTASYPLDTLRRRLQVNGGPGTSVQYRCVLVCLINTGGDDQWRAACWWCMGTVFWGVSLTSAVLTLLELPCTRPLACCYRPPAVCRGYIHCLRHMSQGGLLRQLFKGWGVNCIKTAPGAACQFVAYDLLRLLVTSLDPSSGAVSPL